ncbi:DGQHR domain-containing protein [Gammaproteobacteria bacterium]|nr:DGQHR domain-containing protein [Gammaproteobacteria bacterium]
MLFKDKFTDSIEAEAFDEVKFNLNGPVKKQKWKNVKEDEEWSVFEKDARQLLIDLGATYINLGDFKFDLKAYNHPTRKTAQIDAIGYIEHNKRRFLLIVECKHRSKQGINNAAVKGAFNKISTDRNLINRRIKTLFKGQSKDDPEEHRIQPIYILATRGHPVTEENQKAFSVGGVIHLADQELDYFNDCYEISKNSYFSFNQFMGMYRNGSKPIYKQLDVGALKTHTDEKRQKFAYTFTAEAEELMPLCLVQHRKAKGTFVSQGMDDDEEFINSLLDDDELIESQQNSFKDRHTNYQRVLTKRRITEISNHLETSQTPFSNNILISYRGKPKNFDWKQHKKIGQGKTGNLTVDGRPGQFHVIDGQHRLFGYSGSSDKNVLSHPIIVTAFFGLTELEEAKIFIDVNENQKKVDVSLKMEVQYLLGEKAKGKAQVENLATSIILQLRENEKSPFSYKPVAIPQPESSGLLPTPQLKIGLMNGNLIAKKSDFTEGQMNFKKDFKKTGDFATKILIWFFREIRESIENSWKRKTKNNPNSPIQSHFIVGLIFLVERIIDHESKKQGADVSHTNLQRLIEPYLRSLCESLKSITLEQKELLFGWSRSGIPLKRGSGSYPLARRIIINQLLPQFPELIYKNDPDFEDEGSLSKKLEEELAHIYDLGSVQNIVDQYEPVFFENFHNYLVALFGDHYWQGVIQSEFSSVFAAGEKVRNLKEVSVKKRARNAQLSPKEIALEKKSSSYGDNHVYWLDWPHIKEILVGLYQDKDSQITVQINNPAEALDIKDEIGRIFFVQAAGKTNKPQSAKEGLQWIDFIEMLGNPAAHKRPIGIISPQEEKEFNEIKEAVIKNLITKIQDSVEELDRLALEYDSSS